MDMVGPHVVLLAQSRHAGPQAVYWQAVGRVDAGRAQDRADCGSSSSSRPELSFRGDPTLGPVGLRLEGPGLIDPGACAVTIHSGGAHVDPMTGSCLSGRLSERGQEATGTKIVLIGGRGGRQMNEPTPESRQSHQAPVSRAVPPIEVNGQSECTSRADGRPLLGPPRGGHDARCRRMAAQLADQPKPHIAAACNQHGQPA